MNRFLRSLIPRATSHTFQAVSDLHLEIGQLYDTYRIPSQAQCLVLGGDIGRLIDYESYLRFLEAHKNRFTWIFLVLGNHEFYGLSHTEGLKEARKMANEPTLDGKVILLDQTRFDIPNSSITILGCTLWSKIPEEAALVVRSRVKDFQKISDWTVDDHNKAFESDHNWLRREISALAEDPSKSNKKLRKRTIAIVTHHAPAIRGTSHPDHENNPWSSAFATDLLSSNGTWSNVRLWIFGHTHFTADFVACGIRLFSNQRGYVLPGSTEAAASRKLGSKKLLAFDVNRILYI